MWLIWVTFLIVLYNKFVLKRSLQRRLPSCPKPEIPCSKIKKLFVQIFSCWKTQSTRTKQIRQPGKICKLQTHTKYRRFVSTSTITSG